MANSYERRISALEARAATRREPWANTAVVVVFANDGASAEVLRHPDKVTVLRAPGEAAEVFEARSENAARERGGDVVLMTRRQFEAARQELGDEFEAAAERVLRRI